MSIIRVSPRISLRKGLVADWELDEASGNMVDSSGNGHTMTASGSPVSGTGYIGNARALLAASSQFGFIDAASATDFDPGANSFSIQARVFPTILGAAVRGIFSKNNATGNQREWSLFYTNTGFWRFSASSGGTANQTVTSLTTPVISGWTDLFAGYDAVENVIWIYVPGSPLVRSSFNGGVFAGTARLVLGADNAGAASLWTGSIDTVRYWSRKLTWPEIRYLDHNWSI